MSKYGIDISYCQKGIDWNEIEKKCDFVIIRAGNDMQNRFDTCFLSHITEAHKRKIPIGIYWYGLAYNAEQAKQEAEWLIDYINKNNIRSYIELPIYYDEEIQEVLQRCDVSGIVDAFRQTIANAGFKTGLYCSTGWITCIKNDIVNKFNSVWIAEWSNHCSYTGKYDIWQTGKTPKFGTVVADEDIMLNNILPLSKEEKLLTIEQKLNEAITKINEAKHILKGV